MGAEIVGVSEGFLTVQVTGLLKKSEVDRMQAAAIDLIQKHGKIRVLMIAKDFLGWDREGGWGDVSFQVKYDAHIEKIAIVGEKQWEDLALAFSGRGFRPVAIKYFSPADFAKARTWVTSKP